MQLSQVKKADSLVIRLLTLLQAEFCEGHQRLCSQGHSYAFLQSLPLLPELRQYIDR